MSHLRVYDTEAPDGLAGGTPHLHTLCTEAYAVVAGAGRVQTLTTSGFREVPLEPGALVWFTPGTIHRLIYDGELEILVLMQNAGLPEAGDMVITLAPDVVDDPARYAAAATLPADEQTTAGTGAAARARRDAAVSAFVELRSAAEVDGGAALARFHAAAAALVRPLLDRFEQVWRDGPHAAACTTEAQLAALAAGDLHHLTEASVHRLDPPPAERRMGCCGTLGTYVA
jgi:mannose-6-phosphate isomerase-like protein (cupin superfamily)